MTATAQLAAWACFQLSARALRELEQLYHEVSHYAAAEVAEPLPADLLCKFHDLYFALYTNLDEMQRVLTTASRARVATKEARRCPANG